MASLGPLLSTFLDCVPRDTSLCLSSPSELGGLKYLVEKYGFSNVDDSSLRSLPAVDSADIVTRLVRLSLKEQQNEASVNLTMGVLNDHSNHLTRSSASEIKALIRARFSSWTEGTDMVNYLVSAIEDSGKISKKMELRKSSSAPVNAPAAAAAGSKATKSLPELQIEQISQVLPHLGLGYIELALACYSTPESTIDSLLSLRESDLHPRLRGVDVKLPKRKIRDRSNYDADNMKEADRAKQKEALNEIAKKQVGACRAEQCTGDPSLSRPSFLPPFLPFFFLFFLPFSLLTRPLSSRRRTRLSS